MATIQEGILEKFYRRLAETEGFTPARIEQLRALFNSSKKPKAADLMKVFSDGPKESQLS